MFNFFDLKNKDYLLKGYHYGVDNPNHVVCLIHGIGEHDGRYKRVAEYFNKEGIAIIGMDLRGHGLTGGVRGDCAPRKDVLEDISCLITYAKEKYPNVPLILYGHSMGGGLVSDYRARGSKNGEVDGYLISAPWLKLVKSYPKFVVSILGLFSKVCPKLKISSSCEESDLGNLDYVRPYKEDPLVHPYITLRTAYEGFSIGCKIYEGKNIDNGKAKNIPTLVMHGEADKICDVTGTRKYAKLNEKYDTFKYIEWPGYYHEIHNGGPNGETGEEPIKEAIKFILSI